MPVRENTSFSIVDESFDKGLSSTYHLSVQLSPGCLSLGVFDLKNKRLVALESTTVPGLSDYDHFIGKAKKLFEDSAVFSPAYKSVSVGIYHPVATIIPSALYDANLKKEILEFNFKGEIINPLDIAADHIQEAGMHTLYIMPAGIRHFFSEYFFRIKTIHFSTPIIENLFFENKFKKDTKVYLHFLNKVPDNKASRFEIIIFSNGKLLFYNSFVYQEKEDIAYYTLFVMEQMNIVPGETGLTLLGNISEKDEAVILLSNYVAETAFGRRPGKFTFPDSIEKVPDHHYYGLLCQYLMV